jgi:PAS domain S-box-containing protein
MSNSQVVPMNPLPFQQEFQFIEENEPSTLQKASENLNLNFSGAHLTDFTKKKNWPMKILSELQDLLHVISPSGMFLFCSPSCLQTVGYSSDELIGRNITDFIHVDDIDTFIREFNLSIHSGFLKTFYRFRKKDDKFVVLEVHGHPYFDSNEVGGFAKCFFIMARPYPTRTASMLDSFLHLKVENELLKAKLIQLKVEAGEVDPQQLIAKHAPSSTSATELSDNLLTSKTATTGAPQTKKVYLLILN